MHLLPRVTELSRERVARELDDIGPTAVANESTLLLSEENPELLDMATRCARDVGNAGKVMVGFGAFYRALVLEAHASSPHPAFAKLPRVSSQSRERLIGQIDERGAEQFTADTVDHMGEHNPELLQLAHGFASRHPAYIEVMQGFCLMYKALVIEAASERHRLH